MKQTAWWIPIVLMMGLVLAGAKLHDSLPADYWNMPQAAVGNAHHDWSAMEKNMRPEACAQCHQEQFNAWRNSRHAHAYSPGLVGQFSSMGHAAGNDCLLCHAPLAQQLYRDAGDMDATLDSLLANPEGFSRDANLDAKEAKLPLRHAGVTCAVCHVRQGQRFGPPRRASDAVGHMQGAAHGGFMASKAFEQSQLCAGCHQFPQAYAINGKPLENTLTEWKESRFSRSSVQCQTCHMVDRKHAFKGVHDKQMVLSGLDFELKQEGELASLSLSSTHIGHAFPTYVTPKIIVNAEALDIHGKRLQQWQWEIIREVEYNNGWQEVRDSRLQAGEKRKFVTADLSNKAVVVHFVIDVIPDYFYKGVYKSLLANAMQGASKKLIEKALADANKNDYRLYDKTLKVH